MPVPRFVVSVVLLLGLAVAAMAHLAGIGPVAGPVRSAQAGVSSCELLVNGSFESPPVPASTTATGTPTGWSGEAVVRNGSVGRGGPTSGAQFVDFIFGQLSQDIPTASLDGQTLTVSFDLRTFNGVPVTVTLGSSSQTFESEGAYSRFSLATRLPDLVPATTTISFDGGILNLDDVSVTASVCDQPPVISLLRSTLTTAEDTPISVSFIVSDSDTPLRNLTLTATGPGGDRVTFGGRDLARTLTYTPAFGATGPDSFTVRVSDGVNTDAQEVAVRITSVNDPPVFNDDIPADRAVEATSDAGASVTFTSPTATDPNPGDTVTVSCDPASGSIFPLGMTTVTCTASDGTLTDTASFTVTVQDTTAPVMTVPDPITVEATRPDGAAVEFTATATDLVDGTVTVSCDPASGTTFPFGTTTVTCTATDAADNTGNGSFTVTVVDTTPPVLTVPGPLAAEAASAAGVTVTFTVTATDTVDPSVDLVCRDGDGNAVATGDRFPLGETSIDCVATDDTGNESASTFTVTVVDTTAPVLSVPDDITAEATGPGGAAVDYSVIATDLVDGPVIPSCSLASGSTFPLGVTTTVICTATDAASNAASAGFAVTVVDTTPPVVSVPGPITVEGRLVRGAVVDYTVTATDAVDGALTPVCDIPSGSTFSLGETWVTCTATDGVGNVGSASFPVTVVWRNQDQFPDAPVIDGPQAPLAPGSPRPRRP